MDEVSSYESLEVLNQFNADELLWVFCDVVQQLGDAEAELSDECLDAVDFMEDLEDVEKLRLIRGITIIKFDSEDSPTEPEEITSYSNSEAACECADTWGDYLEKLSINDATWILFSLAYDIRDWSKCHHKDELNKMAESIENGELNEDELKLLGCQLVDVKQKKNKTNGKLTDEELTEAREWIKDCIDCWYDLDKDDVDELTNVEVEKAIERYFSGGIKEFKRSV